MSKLNQWKSRTSLLIALLMSTTALVPIVASTPASAQIFPPSRDSVKPHNQATIPIGTQIPVKYDEAEKILVAKNETMPLTLTVAANIVNRRGTILIPYNSKIVGQIEPAYEGSRFVASELIINGKTRLIDAESEEITRTEEIKQGASTGSILKGAAIGAGAASVIAVITGDNAIATEEVLGGGALGALGGLLLGKKTVEVVSINPETDLTLTLNSNLSLGTPNHVVP